jgi:5-methylthioadenosine/S-adenosylhomocysteine deaminase
VPGGEAPPVRDAGVIVDDEGTVLEAGPFTSLTPAYDIRYNHPILMPGVLNCHVHLTDAGIEEPVPGGNGLNSWVRSLMAVRSGGLTDEAEHQQAVERVLARMRESGTVAVGEVANDFRTLGPIVRSGIRCRFIYELLGFRDDRADQVIERARGGAGRSEWNSEVRFALGAHAPYSVSPRLMHAIDRMSSELGTLLYEHLAEDPQERLLYHKAAGEWRGYLEEVGAWEPAWEPTGGSPIEFYEAEGLLTERLVAVHLADATAEEIGLLARRGVRAILSPTSNLHLTGLLPDLEAIVASGMTFALGTDGRGSNPSIDVFDEALLLHKRWPGLRPGLLLRALTTSGAEILQFDTLGSVTVGRVPGLISVEPDSMSTDIAGLEAAILECRPPRKRVA